MIHELYITGRDGDATRVYIDREEVTGLSSLTVSLVRGAGTRAVLEYSCRTVEYDGAAEIVHVCPHSTLGDPDHG